MPVQYFITSWNLENLFDIEGSPRRDDKLQRAIGKDLHGWTQALLDRKINQLASIIKQMNGAHGPDLMGIYEVENRYVVDLLVQALAPLGRNYQVIHHDTPDRRGIDVAFIYDAALFTVPLPLDQSVFSHFVMRRTATRDILQVNFKTAAHGRLFVVMGNHWPSRSGGQAESDAYRDIAGETLAYFNQRVYEVMGDKTPVLAMGDFNDEPFSASLVDYALAHRSSKFVLGGKDPYFQDLMWALMGQGLGSLYFDKEPNLLDQFLADKNLLKAESPIRVLPESVQILHFPEMVAKGAIPQPVPFGGMGKPVNQNGFSDHFPVCVTVVEAD
jgi:endonuclease/exonuclease/phosphatase family metal-dependent hydrolase